MSIELARETTKRQWEVKKLTERDLELLFGLYFMRTLTVQQLYDKYFESSSKRYTYLRLHQLKKAGYVESRPLINEEGYKRGAYYSVTKKGIDTLVHKGKIDSSSVGDHSTIIRRACKNRPSRKEIKSMIERNSIYLILEKAGWTIIESRDFKRINGLNRGSVVKGGIRTDDGKEYALYVLAKTPRKYTVKKILTELKNSHIRNVIILMKSTVAYQEIITERRLILDEMNILPYKIGLNILKKFPSDRSFVNIFTNFGVVSNVLNKHQFGKYLMITPSGEEKYICNYLLGDEMAIRFLKKYTWDRYELDGKKVVLFIWDNQLLELGKGYEHVEIVQIPFDIQV
ncbi:replication-relaxation family protein [Brevibacillus laterosporus]|uniref:replication-relaxation family protein n=1 Tax=Brevibacillus laterosporus TaxID=1465 RepID=UPI00112BD4EA|nr:replication-relaxation family protein [Brevibacillus laterosporus]MBG9790984.1 hypothetical protein [Brevibacillus laterosporus]MBG9804893.1 hypothetical protein [Brevibacillus laterosporus]MED1790541.1 replication-relaxation family protein [Brevibacillus laterosporus]MED4762098.1 replication-relaxation family protein [Brevibacillus laterosporus]TPH09960.1 hypothetical protein EGH09_21630 [Brevibacillus laterosporus]